MNKVTIVFVINNKFATPAYISIRSLLDYAKETTTYQIIVIHDDLSTLNQKMLINLAAGERHNILTKKVKSAEGLYGNTSYKWPKVVYYRLYLADILQAYNKIIFSDVDVFFKGDLSEIWSLDISNVELAAVPAEKNNSNVIMHQYFQENNHELIYMAGFLIMNLKMMRALNWTQRCKKTIKKFNQRLIMCDLDVINLAAGDIINLPLRYILLQSVYDNYVLEKATDYIWLKGIYNKEYIENEKENTVIIHYAGKDGKPWLRKNIPEYYKEYLDNMPLHLRMQNNFNRFFNNFRRFMIRIYRLTLKKLIEEIERINES